MHTQQMTRACARAVHAGARWFAAVAVMAFVITACNTDRLLDVKAIDRVDAGIFDDPAQAKLMVNSVIADFECAYASAVLVEAIISDEMADAQLGAAGWPYDRRDANVQTGGAYGVNSCSNNQTPGIYLPLSTARWAADNALTKLQGWTDQQVPTRSELTAKAALYAGFSYAMMGMSMCEAAFDLEAQIDQAAMFGRAEDRFSTALTAAQSAGLDDIRDAAYVGRARVRLFLNKLAEAAADAANVPADFAFDATYDGNNSRRYNRVYASAGHFAFYTVESSSRALTTEGVADPRAAVVLTGLRAADAVTPIYRAVKYDSDDTPIHLATYTEAQLIRAEALGGTTAVNIVNALRDEYSLPHYTGATDAASIRTLIINERQRALFIEGFRNYDIQRFSIPFNPAVGTPYPDKGGNYGNTTCLPLPDNERFNNPNVH